MLDREQVTIESLESELQRLVQSNTEQGGKVQRLEQAYETLQAQATQLTDNLDGSHKQCDPTAGLG